MKMKRTSWNKGLTKENNEKIRNMAKKLSIKFKGKKFRYGKSKYNSVLNFCKIEYPSFIGTRKEFIKLLKEKFNFEESEEKLLSYVKSLKIKKPKVLRGFYTKCLNCKKEYYLPKCCKKYNQNLKFCSKECYGKFLSDTYPKNIKKDAWKKAVKTNKLNGNYKRNSIRMARENNPNWHGGISRKGYTVGFNYKLKEKIRIRDNRICQECGKKEKEMKIKLAIHHIDFDKKNNKENNLISLCRSCHTKTNFDRNKWIKYYKLKMEVD